MRKSYALLALLALAVALAAFLGDPGTVWPPT